MPYILMDRVPGMVFWRAVQEKVIGREQVYETLRQLATFKKTLQQHPLPEIGSISVDEWEGKVHYHMDQNHNIWNVYEHQERYKYQWGPFDNPIQYYANLLTHSWSKKTVHCQNHEDTDKCWKIHTWH
jgi:hypothetical protein